MICPECDGAGRVRRRFLFFFTRHARCRKCLGTGVFPPPARDAVRYPSRYRDDDDDRWPAASYGSTASDPRPRNDDRFEVGSGGRSGGGGGGASWGESTGSDAPVIADPFAASGSSAIDSVVAADASSSDSGPADSGSSDSGSDAGPSY